MQKYIISNKDSGQTLEKFVKKVLKDAPLSIIYKLFRKKDVKVNGHWEKEKYIVSEGEEISIFLPDEKLNEFIEQKEVENIDNVSSWIIYEDENIILVNKPRGVLVQKGKEDDVALDDMVVAYLVNKGEYDPNKDLSFTPAPVHRLDRNTAGIVIFGKNLKTIQYLNTVINDKNIVQKEYLALVKGHVLESGIIDKPLFKKTTHVEVNEEEGKEAVTQYSLVRHVSDYSLVNVVLLTGRTHQIRVHFSYINHPIIGDSKYGDYSLNKKIEELYKFKNQFLVAYKLKFKELSGHLDYLSNKTFEVELPHEFIELLQILEHN